MQHFLHYETMPDVIAEPLTLYTREAVDLAHVWVQNLADRCDIRALFIKGPPLHRLGLRATRGSSDVDVLVSPKDFERMCTELRRRGWGEREAGFLMSNVPLHSRTFIADGWPCDIDVHAYFPGFLTDPSSVFESLWERRTHLSFAGKQCNVPDRVSSALMLALHSLRSTQENSRHDAELEQMLGAAFTSSERAELGALAARTGCTETLSRVLPGLGVVSTASAAPIDMEALLAWNERTAVRKYGLGTYDLLRAFRRAPLTLKPKILLRAVWPSDEDLRSLRPGISNDTRSKNAARIERLRKGLSALPGVAISILHNRRAG